MLKNDGTAFALAIGIGELDVQSYSYNFYNRSGWVLL